MAKRTRSFLNVLTGGVEHVPDLEDKKNNQASLYGEYESQTEIYVEVDSDFEPTEENVAEKRKQIKDKAEKAEKVESKSKAKKLKVKTDDSE